MVYSTGRGIGLRRSAMTSPLQRSTGASNTGMTLYRSKLMVRDNSFGAPIRKFTPGMMMPSTVDVPTQADIDRQIERIMNEQPVESQIDELLELSVRSSMRRLIRDGLGYCRDGDYIRAMGAFDAALTADRGNPIPRFGNLVIDVTRGHYARAVQRLITLAKYDSTRRRGTPSLFQYKVTLLDYFESEEQLREQLLTLRKFTQKRLDNVNVQALYCYMLWYAGIDSAKNDAKAIASGIARTHPESPWSLLYKMMEEAERPAPAAPDRAEAPTIGEGVPSTPNG
jgi:hypothetical protein